MSARPLRSVMTRSIMVMALASIALPAAAAVRVEIEAGRSYMDSYATNTAFVEGVFDEHRIGDSRFSWSPDVSLGWIDGRDIAGYDNYRHDGHLYSTRDQSWLLAGGARFRYGDPGDWYRSLFFSFQPALHTGRTLALSTPYEFVSTLGWQGRHFMLGIRHISNGDLHSPNRGETMALVGIGFDL
ncbi:lipid A 3-O-deacylase [Rhodanobacter sp. C01]|nr:lipid A 3-O-deacylase [Rhodanobacter sp. C01]